MRLLVRFAVVPALAGVAVLGACSSSGSQSSASGGGSSSSGSTATSQPTGSVIKVGVIGSLSGSQASSSDQGGTVAPAWADYVNQELGGIRGHRVQVIVQDDKGDPAQAQQAAKTLIDDHVVAIIVSSDNLVTAYDDQVIKSGIPLIAGSANSGDWLSKKGMYALPTDFPSFIRGSAIVAKRFGKATKMADLYCQEVAACAQLNPPMQAKASELGVKFTSLAISSTATSYTAQCLQLQQQKVDYVVLSLATAAAVKVVQDCQSQNYNPTWGVPGEVVGPDFLKLQDFTAYGPDIAFPSFLDLPSVATFRSAMKKYAKDDNWHEGVASVTWAGLEGLRTALTGLGSNATVTSADATNGLTSFNGQSLDGLVPNKVSFSGGNPTAPGSHPCFYVIKVSGGKESSPSGSAPVCP